VNGVEIFSDANHVTVRDPVLQPGVWTLHISNGASGDSLVLAVLSGVNRQGVQMRLFFGNYNPTLVELPNTNQFLVGQPMPIQALLTDLKGPVPGAKVEASVEHPDGVATTIPLYDDGYHNDGEPDDGLYGGFYYRTTVGSMTHMYDNGAYNQRGSYNVTAMAAGKSNIGESFNRLARGSFSVFDPKEQPSNLQDSDKDGMNNGYEQSHPCLNYLVYDAKDDPDNDGLDNLTEYSVGTDPCQGDSDGGGESDGSELSRGANPIDASDDAIPAPIDVGVITKVSNDLRPLPDLKPNDNLIRFSGGPYKFVLLYRSNSASGPFSLIKTIDAKAEGGLFHDNGLANGVTYYYYIQGQNIAGALSAPSYIFHGTPRADPFAPIGSFTIGSHAYYVLSTSVLLHLVLEDATFTNQYLPVGTGDGQLPAAPYEMLIDNDPAFANAQWQTFQTELQWALRPDRNGDAWVYVRFRDPDGNESEIYNAHVRVRLAREVGTIRLRALFAQFFTNGPSGLAAAVDASGTYVGVLGNSPYPPAYTDANGDASLDNLDPGKYDVLIQRPGYEPLVLEGVSVQGGGTTTPANQTLYPWGLHLPLMFKP
jgi:hypothetical protein